MERQTIIIGVIILIIIISIYYYYTSYNKCDNKLKECFTEIGELNDVILKIKETMDAIVTEKIKIESTLNEYKDKNNSLQSIVDKLKQEIIEHKNNISSLNKQLTDKINELANKLIEIDQIKATNTTEQKILKDSVDAGIIKLNNMKAEYDKYLSDAGIVIIYVQSDEKVTVKHNGAIIGTVDGWVEHKLSIIGFSQDIIEFIVENNGGPGALKATVQWKDKIYRTGYAPYIVDGKYPQLVLDIPEWSWAVNDAYNLQPVNDLHKASAWVWSKSDISETPKSFTIMLNPENPDIECAALSDNSININKECNQYNWYNAGCITPNAPWDSSVSSWKVGEAKHTWDIWANSNNKDFLSACHGSEPTCDQLTKEQYYYYYNPDVLAAGVPALDHYISNGKTKGRKSCYTDDDLIPNVVIGIGSSNDIWQSIAGTDTWTLVPGQLQYVSVGKDWVYGIDVTNGVWKCKKPCNGGWELIPNAQLTQLSVGDTEVWGIGGANDIWKSVVGSNTWTLVPGQLQYVSVGKDWVYGIGVANDVWKCKLPCTGAWELIPNAQLTQLSVGDTEVWGIGGANDIWKSAVGSNTFSSVPGSIKQVSIGKSWVYGLTPDGIGYDNQVWRCKLPCTGAWELIPNSHLTQVNIG